MSNSDEHTSLTSKDIDNFVEKLMNEEIKSRKCFKCSNKYFPSYGAHLDECDKCFFSRFPKESVEKFYRSFLE